MDRWLSGHMSKSEIESSYHSFDEKQLLVAVKRLLELAGG